MEDRNLISTKNPVTEAIQWSDMYVIQGFSLNGQLSPCMFPLEPWGHRLPRRSSLRPSLRLHHLPARNGASSTRYHRLRDPPSSALHGPRGAPSTPGTLASPPSVGGLAPHQPCSGCSHRGFPSAGRLSRGPRYQWRSTPERRSAVARRSSYHHAQGSRKSVLVFHLRMLHLEPHQAFLIVPP